MTTKPRIDVAHLHDPDQVELVITWPDGDQWAMQLPALEAVALAGRLSRAAVMAHIAHPAQKGDSTP
jgi:hypothetical protein